ncbi:fructose-2,6-bisphosphatase [Ameyamaea chiangmaiensis NBRC 103196]|uniref:Histidine phosphatase family protein n=1 Tax=Ameyamaea chiangmaiensis TaxID=442969 RepID=A0A850PH09_9PROT|nr:histidine phosphatase family protein [Ameyamaea chiangmaiensis]MBS4073861.1 histidine phosphatase family protein [Ameyamaea chiangmaiensis]NVN41939.1 histidine phosphatase family protein [Ameyamaea chiangmaiensis]GBQ68150.1 fructose-2,6-bisphosphatase [Ameyamaea chiangmaiensis NBRC 103196]
MIILRHCQSEFNRFFTVSRIDPGIPDAPLSVEGRRQAGALSAALSGERIERILVSPYTRALQTAAPIAARLGLTPELAPLAREQSFFACDIGSPASRLAREWPTIDFSTLDEVWWTSDPESDAAAVARADRLRAELRASGPHETTLLISHWAFLRAFAGRAMPNGSWITLDPADDVAPPPPLHRRPRPRIGRP